jgi:hypothetical protein
MEILAKLKEKGPTGRHFVPPMLRDSVGAFLEGYPPDHLLNSSSIFCVRTKKSDESHPRLKRSPLAEFFYSGPTLCKSHPLDHERIPLL